MERPPTTLNKRKVKICSTDRHTEREREQHQQRGSERQRALQRLAPLNARTHTGSSTYIHLHWVIIVSIAAALPLSGARPPFPLPPMGCPTETTDDRLALWTWPDPFGEPSPEIRVGAGGWGDVGKSTREQWVWVAEPRRLRLLLLLLGCRLTFIFIFNRSGCVMISKRELIGPLLWHRH